MAGSRSHTSLSQWAAYMKDLPAPNDETVVQLFEDGIRAQKSGVPFAYSPWEEEVSDFMNVHLDSRRGSPPGDSRLTENSA
jgi:hypothetical protein